MNDVIIVGTGGLAREAAYIIQEMHKDGFIGKLKGYISEKKIDLHKNIGEFSIVGTDQDELPFLGENLDVVIAIGHPEVKAKISERYIKNELYSFPNIISKNANITDKSLKIGKGNIICSGSIISCDVVISDFCLINWNATIGHDVIIGNNVVINPGAHISGFCSLSNKVLIGAGAVILETIHISENAKVGAGAVVTRNVFDNKTVVGVPARELIIL